ncbi:hypothetical protein FQA39_LY07132 [Lamprigera yunnana]|nr:hypothetical protein FQA39_LY07132 [Lamprigera yunnana]
MSRSDPELSHKCYNIQGVTFKNSKPKQFPVKPEVTGKLSLTQLLEEPEKDDINEPIDLYTAPLDEANDTDYDSDISNYE